ncbi:MAG: FAD-dependent oxidoreductase [Gemmataceae bacterium]
MQIPVIWPARLSLRLAILFIVLFPVASVGQEGHPNLRYYYPVPKANPPQKIVTDVCVYGGTPAGVMMAIQASRMGKSAVLVVFRKHVGGMTSGGLSAVDLGRGDSIQGMAREFLKRVGKQRGFRPSKAEATFRAMLKEANVTVYFEHRLKDVKKEKNRITAITTENGNTFVAKMYGDATYEGDLFAKAGVSYTVGREGNDKYGETLNGVQFRNKHNFVVPIDPYKVPGDPTSGLLWGISPGDPGKPGQADKKVQAYNFRMFFSNSADRLAFPKPKNYDRDKYQLLLRYIKKKPPIPLQLHVGDSNNQGGFSTDHIGANYGWAEGDYATREAIFQDHVNYQQGLMWFWANDPEVPKAMQKRVRAFGLTKGEFPDTGGWPHALYVREGRRMISDYVMTEHNCLSKQVAKDSIGLASYNMDSHNSQRVVIDGRVRNEGDVQVRCPKPYPVSYRSIVPKERECGNLFVPVCLSASHIAYGSIRMEPVFMILGQAAGSAASMAIDGGVSVQKVPYEQLKKRLLADEQLLEWTGPVRLGSGIDPKTLTGIVVDNSRAEIRGEWTNSFSVPPYVGAGYLHDGNDGQGSKSVKYVPKLPSAGEYAVYLIWSTNKNRASNVSVLILHASGTKKLTVDQKKNGGWNKVFTGRFEAGSKGSVTIRNDDANGFVIADAVRWVRVKR